MTAKDLHERPFDEGTITKLEIFESYAKEWLPTFVMSCPNKELWIFDFFAGPGRDITGVAGSPIRLLQQVKEQSGNIFSKKCKIHVCLNEYAKYKYDAMKSCCEEFIKDEKELTRLNNKFLYLHYRNCDFADLFPKTLTTIAAHPTLVFLDQNGMKFLADKYLLDLEKLAQTDFIYYLSSSFFVRFGETQAFQTNLSIDISKIRENPYKYVHKSILEQLKHRLPEKSDLKLYPFTIKKGANIYGIIFGAKHPRAVDKFLKTAWDKNNINGEANFDIDDDLEKTQLSLFDGKLPNKTERFQNELQEKLLQGALQTNKEVYDYTLECGHISAHASDKIKQMKKEGLIDYTGRSPLVNYEQVYKNNRIITFQIIKR